MEGFVLIGIHPFFSLFVTKNFVAVADSIQAA